MYEDEWEFLKALTGPELYRITLLRPYWPKYFDTRSLSQRPRVLPTDKQLEEYRLALVCHCCKRPCGGQCQL
jgi:hypothetical protein